MFPYFRLIRLERAPLRLFKRPWSMEWYRIFHFCASSGNWISSSPPLIPMSIALKRLLKTQHDRTRWVEGSPFSLCRQSLRASQAAKCSSSVCADWCGYRGVGFQRSAQGRSYACRTSWSRFVAGLLPSRGLALSKTSLPQHFCDIQSRGAWFRGKAFTSFWRQP